MIFVPLACAKQRYTSFSVCIEAIREPHLRPFDLYGVKNAIDFSVCLEHGRTAAQKHPDTCKTVGDLVDPLYSAESRQAHSDQNCNVFRQILRELTCRFSVFSKDLERRRCS